MNDVVSMASSRQRAGEEKVTGRHLSFKKRHACITRISPSTAQTLI